LICRLSLQFHVHGRLTLPAPKAFRAPANPQTQAYSRSWRIYSKSGEENQDSRNWSKSSDRQDNGLLLRAELPPRFGPQRTLGECVKPLKSDRETDLGDMLVDVEIIVGLDFYDLQAVDTAAEIRIQVHVGNGLEPIAEIDGDVLR
jgi:hypothetical protein